MRWVFGTHDYYQFEAHTTTSAVQGRAQGELKCYQQQLFKQIPRRRRHDDWHGLLTDFENSVSLSRSLMHSWYGLPMFCCWLSSLSPWVPILCRDRSGCDETKSVLTQILILSSPNDFLKFVFSEITAYVLWLWGSRTHGHADRPIAGVKCYWCCSGMTFIIPSWVWVNRFFYIEKNRSVAKSVSEWVS